LAFNIYKRTISIFKFLIKAELKKYDPFFISNVKLADREEKAENLSPNFDELMRIMLK